MTPLSKRDTSSSPTDPQVLATALRDLSVAAVLFEQNPSDENRKRLNRSADYVEKLLDLFVAAEGDIRPAYLESRSPHYYIEVESDRDTTSRVHDLGVAGEPVVFGPCTYQEARAWCIEHGDPEAAE